MKIKRRPKLLGFTLIELLFVITIVSVLVSLGVAMMQQHNQQAKVKQTALQMQQLLQAGLAYYVDNKCWPIVSVSGCKVNPPPDFIQYIPVNSNVNPWGNSYSFSAPFASIFQVQVNTPTTAIAQRIAGMLPNASVTTCPMPSGGVSPCVYAQTTMPKEGADVYDIYVAAAGVVNDNNATTASFSCKGKDYKSSIQVSLRDYIYANQADLRRINSSSITYSDPVALKLAAKYNGNNYTVGIDSGSYAYRNYSLAGVGACMILVGYANAFYEWRKDAYDKMFKNYTINYTIYCCSPKAIKDGYCVSTE